MKMPVVVQTHPGENAIAVIATMLSYYGCIKSLSELRGSNITSRGGSTPEQVKDMAARYGLDTEILRGDASMITEIELPAVVHWKRRYYCIVKKIRGEVVYLADPARGEYKMELDSFLSRCSGQILIMKPGEGFIKGGRRESLYELIRYRMKGTEKALLWLAILNMLAVGLNLLMVRSTRLMLDTADTKAPADDAVTRILSRLLGAKGDIYTFLVITMAVILILTTIVNILKTFLIFRTSYKVAASSGSGLFSHIIAQPSQFFEEYRSGELIQRMEDNAKLDLSLVRTIVPRLLDFVMTIIYLALMISYQWQVALACVAVEAVYLFVSLRLKDIINMQARANAVSTGNMNTSILNGIDTLETIKAGGAERMFFSGWNVTQMEFDESRVSGNNITAVTGVIDNLHSLLSQAVLLFAGAYFMIQGSFTFGIMAALQAVLGNFRNAFSNCINMFNNLQKMRTDIERTEDIRQRDTAPEHALSDEDEPDKLPGTIEVSHVSYRYQEGEPPAIEDISFTVGQGELIAVVGSSGCGKSTLLKCLLSLYTPESGEIRYGGLTRDEIPDVVFHSSITAVDQECVVFEDTIADNLTMWDSTIEEYEMILAARDAHIHSRIIREREGYYGRMLENGRNFSGGELQRMELARALSTEPNILLLDEFTSALDAITEAEVFKSIRDKGTTCIVVAHRLSTVASCDHILVMEKGRIVQRGTHEELMGREGLYRQLLQVPEEA